MRTGLLLILGLFCCGVVWAQEARITPNDSAQQKISLQQIALNKQIAVDDLESQIKDTPLAAVRVVARYRLATWLWKDGKDDTGRAEALSVKALEELYEKKVEIPAAYFGSLRSDIFALLEKNAKQSAKDLQTKYKLSSEEELNNAYSLLNMKGSEQLAADKIQTSLANQTELSSMTIWLMEELRRRKSPELLRVLAEIISLEESGRSNFSAESLFFAVDFFRDAAVSNDLRIRFYNIICNRARTALPFPDSDAKSVYDLLTAVMPDIAQNASGLLSEAKVLQYAFLSRVPSSEAESIESNQRIDENPDRLDALISEAEASRNQGLRANLFAQAAQLALTKSKFHLAVELIEKSKAEVDEEKDKRFSLWHDQFLAEVSEKALKADDVDSSKYAIERVTKKLVIANTLRSTAVYYYAKGDSVAAASSLERALKLAADADNDLAKISLLIRLISTAQKVDPNRLAEVTRTTVKAINLVPRLAIDDKPDSDNYRKYVSSILTINERLFPVFGQLVKRNRDEAVAFAAGIDTRDIRLMLNYAFLVDSPQLKAKPRL
jgi:hypothetical protein